MIGATATLGRFVAQAAREPLPAAVAGKAAICLLDAFGLALLAREERSVWAMQSLAARVRSDQPGARLWSDGTHAALSDAVAANATAVHALFQDDNDVPSWSHPASLVSPVALCVGEAVDAPLDHVLRAVAIGYAAMSWLGAGERVARALIRRGIRTSPTLGTLGAACAAAAALRLDEAQATSAVGIASSITGGTLEPVGSGSDEWRLQNAHAARGGLLAAQCAQAGLRGAAAGLEGAKGLARAFAGLEQVPEWEQPPATAAILGVWAKPWATLGDNVPAVCAAAALRASGVAAERVRRLEVTIWRPYAEYPGTAYSGPFGSVAQALASTAFGVAAMLALGELHYAVSLERRDDARIAALVPLVTVRPHDGEWHEATVDAELDDGTRVRRTCADGPRALMFQDEATAARLFAERAAQAGLPSGHAGEAAAALLAGGAGVGTREWLDRLLGTVARG